MKLIISEVSGRIPVFVSTGHTGTHVAVQLSKAAQDAGADGLMILPPYFLKPTAEDLFDYYRAISNAVSIPIMIQDAPLLDGRKHRCGANGSNGSGVRQCPLRQG